MRIVNESKKSPARLLVVLVVLLLLAASAHAVPLIEWVPRGADDAHINTLVMDDTGGLVLIGTDQGFRILSGPATWTAFEEPGVPGRAVHAAVEMHSSGGVITGRVDADGHGYLERNLDSAQGEVIYSSTCGAFVDVAGIDYDYPGNTMWACSRAGETPGELLLSLDLGQTWQPVTGHGHQDLYDLVHLEWGPGGVLVAGDGGITYSGDQGQTWQDVAAGLPDVQVRRLWETSPAVGLPDKSRQLFYVYTCTDGGLFRGRHDPEIGVCTWEPAPLIAEPVQALGFFFYGEHLFGGIALTDAGRVLVDYSGLDWEDLTGLLDGLDILPVESALMVATADAGVWFLDGLLTPVEQPPTRPLLALQAAPNPFNPTTTLRYEVPGDGPVRLTVHDLAGRCVATLLDGEVPAGAGEVTWRPRDLGSGVYLALLAADGRAVVQRLVLVR